MALSADVEHGQGADIKKEESVEAIQRGSVCMHSKSGCLLLNFQIYY